MKAKKITGTLILLTQLVFICSAATFISPTQQVGEINVAMRNIGAVLAIFLLSFQGLRWVMSETPADRSDAKKGLIYIIIGVVIIYLAAHIVCGLYGLTLGAYGITCTLDSVNFSCDCL